MAEPRIHHELLWEGDKSGAEGRTWGRLSVYLDGSLLWGAAEGSAKPGIRWTWVDLLEHVAEVWPWLTLEEGWPPEIDNPRNFVAEADGGEEALFEFRCRHDLAMAIQGKLVPSLWVVREGQQAWIGAGNVWELLPFDAVRSWLESLAGEVATQLAGAEDERAEAAVDSWEQRMCLSRSELAAISVGVSPEELAELAGGDPAAMFELGSAPSATFEPNELLAAARMAVPTTESSVVRSIIVQMKSIGKHETPDLDRLSAKAVAYLAAESTDATKPHVLGYLLAQWLRREMLLGSAARVEPEQLLEQWGVHVALFSETDDGIEALACWGPSHGPAVLVNTEGRHSRHEPGRRATFAHELGHLLVDRSAALPLAEVLGGHVARSVEQRAGAFAAEFLIPRDCAGTAFHHGGEPSNVLSLLCEQYGASREVVAWQAYNSRYPMDWHTFSVLREEVSHPDRFHWNVARRG